MGILEAVLEYTGHKDAGTLLIHKTHGMGMLEWPLRHKEVSGFDDTRM